VPTITDIVGVDYPNPSPVSYGAFTKVLGQLARERQYMTQEEAIRKMTYTHRASQLLSGRGWENLEALVS
jgi:N-acyl-D-aspartate/D-glutamate deacylase